MSTKNIFRSFLAIIAAAFVLCGCDGDEGSDDTRIRFVHAAIVNQVIDFLIDGEASSSLPYGQVGSYDEVDVGTHTLRGSTSGTDLFNVQSLFHDDIDYTVVAIQQGSSVTPLIFVDENDAPDVGNFKLRAINASNTAVDIYALRESDSVTDHDVNFSNLLPTQASNYDQIDRNEYIIYATTPGSKTVIASTNSNEFRNFEVWTVLVINDPDGSGITLVLTEDRDDF